MTSRFGFPVLFGDIGGTHARFAMLAAADCGPEARTNLAVKDHADIEPAIDAAIAEAGGAKPKKLMLGIPAPLFGERFSMINSHWQVDPHSILRRYGLVELVLVNDFIAQGLAALTLDTDRLVSIGGGEPGNDHPRIVVGPGSGLGVVALVPIEGRWLLLPSEGGQIDLGARTEREAAVFTHMPHRKGRLPVEMAVSGHGLGDLHDSVLKADGRTAAGINATDVCDRARGGDRAAGEAVVLFLDLLARFAGDMALVTLARGGVYLAGGMVPKMGDLFDPERFRREFDNKAPYEAILRETPLRIMPGEDEALDGLVALARTPERFDMTHAGRVFRPD